LVIFIVVSRCTDSWTSNVVNILTLLYIYILVTSVNYLNAFYCHRTITGLQECSGSSCYLPNEIHSLQKLAPSSVLFSIRGVVKCALISSRFLSFRPRWTVITVVESQIISVACIQFRVVSFRSIPHSIIIRYWLYILLRAFLYKYFYLVSSCFLYFFLISLMWPSCFYSFTPFLPPSFTPLS